MSRTSIAERDETVIACSGALPYRCPSRCVSSANIGIGRIAVTQSSLMKSHHNIMTIRTETRASDNCKFNCRPKQQDIFFNLYDNYYTF